LGAGLFGLQGSLTFGDNVGIAPTVFRDENVTVVFEDRFVGADKYGITVVGNATGETTFSLGTKIGTGDTAVGVDGVTFFVPTNTLSASIGDASASFVASDADLQLLQVYGSKLDGFSGGVTLSADLTNGVNHDWISNQIVNCGQADIGIVNAQDDAFDNNQEVSGSGLLWGSGTIDIKDSTFTGNRFGIEHEESGSFTYNGLFFTSNDFDVLNSSSGSVTISVVGDGDTPTIFNSGSADTLVIAQTQVTLTGMTSGSEVRVYDSVTEDEIAGVENVGDTGEFAFTDNAGNIVFIVIHAIDYVYQLIEDFEIPTTDTELPITQRFDRNYDNPA
jgi:hypothetical protein